ncbi:MAG: multi-sensor signal transduction histidine kinase [Ramlibacter sp.]|nr:multi-sensor signal transduction histidine kinase [Ramlibacter sp.]
MADLDAFAHSVAHDLREPLHVISGFARMLELDDTTLMSAQGRRRLGRILESASEMSRLIDGILASARAERVEVRFSPVRLDELVQDVLRDVLPDHPAAEVVVSGLPVVTGDPALVRQVFANLIGNALKFSARRQPQRVEIGAGVEGHEQVLFVRDNGVGFAPEDAARLFTPFLRGTDDATYAGMGVGLSIVKRVIQRHGGWIRADSRIGGPTVFSFNFGDSAK